MSFRHRHPSSSAFQTAILHPSSSHPYLHSRFLADKTTTSMLTSQSQHSLQLATIMSGLPPSYILRSFSSLGALRIDAEQVLRQLDERDDGNQNIILLKIPKPMRVQLDENKNLLNGVGFRFMFENRALVVSLAAGQPLSLNRGLRDLYQNCMTMLNGGSKTREGEYTT